MLSNRSRRTSAALTTTAMPSFAAPFSPLKMMAEQFGVAIVLEKTPEQGRRDQRQASGYRINRICRCVPIQSPVHRRSDDPTDAEC